MSDCRVIKRINGCDLTGYEQEQILAGFPVRRYSSSRGEVIRLVAYDGIVPASGLIIERSSRSGWTIQHLYTDPSYRGKGYARSLLALARMLYKNVSHSNDLTEDGKKFAQSCK